MTRPAGKLIVLEGIDGSGKTTLAQALAAALASEGWRVRATREPTDGPFGRRIREIARLGRSNITREEELELFHRDREAHVAEVVRPALEAGEVVVQDRSYHSTVAYQGERGLDRDFILQKERAIAPEPDVVLVVDIPVEVALARIEQSRGGGADDFEKRDALERIRQVFLGIPGAQVLDGTLDRAALLGAALRVVRPRLSSVLPRERSG